MLKRSVEDPNVLYVSFFGRRLIFYEGKYSGWYRPGKKEKN